MSDQDAPKHADPDEFYSPSMRKLQREHQTEKLANAVINAIVFEELIPDMAGFISSRDYFFLSTVDEHGEPSVSYKGGRVGVAHVVNPKKIVFPSFNGNGMFFSAGNISMTGKVGLLFIDMCTPARVRVQGTARLSHDEDYMRLFPGAEFVIEVAVEKAFFNCARYVHKHERIEAVDKYVPDDEGKQPLPAWKRIDHLQEALPPEDIGRAAENGGTITDDEYMSMVKEGTS